MNIVLHEPGIALNTGNIGRTCVASGTSLHLIRPYGFRINEKEIARAGMDYWHRLVLHEYTDYEDFCARNFPVRALPVPGSSLQAGPTVQADPTVQAGSTVQVSSSQNTLPASAGPARVWYATTKAHNTYADVQFGPDDFIMFGNESRGIPEEILAEHPESCIRIPMAEGERSLNLANSVAIVLYEALRQQGFPGLATKGELHRLTWK